MSSALPTTGTYILNFATIAGGSDAQPKNIENVSVTFGNGYFTINGVQHDYDYTWGADGSSQIILGDKNRGYYLLTSSSVNISDYKYKNQTLGGASPNQWVVTSPSGSTLNLGFGDNEFDPCFLAGTMIATARGLVPVEDIIVGEKIKVWGRSLEEVQTVVWIGKSSTVVKPYLPDDRAGYPVRVLANAVADGVPFKDMLVTAEHCLYMDGKFVPVRMLVNGRTVFYDRSFVKYDYYHIETEEHAVIMADGMLTETYLDGGNRGAFRGVGSVVPLRLPRALTWDDAAAPLGTERDFVEPIFRRIEARAVSAKIAARDNARPISREADLRLLTATGRTIRPVREKGGRVMFMVPHDVGEVRVVSNVSRPCDVVGPFVDDRRYFGVLIGDVSIFESNRTVTLSAHLTDENLQGWGPLDGRGARWTDGNAQLRLGARSPNGLALLAIEIRQAGPYLIEDEPGEGAARFLA